MISQSAASCRAAARAGLAALGLLAAAAASAGTEPSGVAIDAVVSEAGRGDLTYTYRVRNGPGEHRPIHAWVIELGRTPNSVELPLDDLVIESANQTWPLPEIMDMIGMATDTMVPVGCARPAGWFCAVYVPNRLGFTAQATAEQVGAGAAREGYRIRSQGLPALRSVLLEPELVLTAQDGELEEQENERARQVYQRSKATRVTLGPSAPPDPFDPVVFLDDLRQQAQRASGELGWIRGPLAGEPVDDGLLRIRSALAGGSIDAARTELDALAERVRASACAAFDCPTGAPLSAEASALLALNLAYLREQLAARP